MGRLPARANLDRGRTRIGLLGSTTLLFAIALIAGFANLSLPDESPADGIDPAARDYRTVAPLGAIAVTTAGPYRAGQRVLVAITPTSSFRADDPGNQPLDFCYRWSQGENCDPSIRSEYVGTDAQGVVTFAMRMPGWVYTPSGRRACSAVHCRVEYQNSPTRKIGSVVLDIDSGPQPTPLARVTSVGKNARVGVRLNAIRPDPTWSRWARNFGPNARRVLPPGDVSICAFTDEFQCDALVRPPAPAFDGKPHETVVRTNRLLFTRRGWVDCMQVQCAITVWRNIGVIGDTHSVGSDVEAIAIAPYRLPARTAVMKKPALTIAPQGAVHEGDLLTVTLREPPPNVDPTRRLFLGQCATKDIPRINDCRTVFADVDGKTEWKKLPDGSLRKRWKVLPCGEPGGCFLAIQPPAKGMPAVARTARFAVEP